MHLKSQSSMEFIVLATFMLLVTVGFFGVTSSRVLEARENVNRRIAEDIAEFAYREIEIATSVNDGYKRSFSMPQNVNGVNYSINIVDNIELTINYLDYEHVRFLPSNVTGNITKGINKISKIDGIIYLNASPVQVSPPLLVLIMKNNLFNVMNFDTNGNVILKGTLQQNTNPVQTADDEFVFKDIIGNNIAIINFINGNMFIKGNLLENQASLSPSALSNDFIVKDSNGNVISYIDESGNFLLKGTLTQNGNP